MKWYGCTKVIFKHHKTSKLIELGLECISSIFERVSSKRVYYPLHDSSITSNNATSIIVKHKADKHYVWCKHGLCVIQGVLHYFIRFPNIDHPFDVHPLTWHSSVMNNLFTGLSGFFLNLVGIAYLIPRGRNRSIIS